MTQTPLAAHVSVFSGSTNTTPVESVPLTTVFERIQDGTYQLDVEQLRRLLHTEGQGSYNDAKKQLAAVTFCGTFTLTRAKANLTQHSGIVHGDLDHLDDLDATRQALCADRYTSYCFVSPSGTGLKLGVRIEPVPDDAAYKHAWQAAADYYRQHYGVMWDPSGKDVSRLCYVSWDPDCHVHANAPLFPVPLMVVPPPRPQTPPRPRDIPSDRRERYAQQALDTAVKIIDASTLGNRHHARTKAAYLLGGYVAGGVLDYGAAHAALEAAVTRNTDHFPAAMKTSADCLQAGMEAAINLEDLEAERLAWLQAHRSTLVVTPHGSTSPPAPDAPQPQTGPTAAATTPPTGSSNGSGPTAMWGTPGHPSPDPRPVIRITTAITSVVDAGQAALVALPNAPVIYQRARQLVIIARGVKPPKWLHRPPDVPLITEVNKAHIEELATQAARWQKFDKRKQRWDDALPPSWFVESLQGRPSWDFPALEGIVCSPTLRPDGSLLNTPGYDLDTGLFLDTNGTTFPTIPLRPTLDDARTALGRLQEAVMDFPFAEPWHFSATLAAVLSLVCRFTVMGNVPLFAIRAHTRASGKSLLADVVSIIGTGRAAPRWPQVTEDEEERKRLLTVALAGYPVIHIDNVTRPLGSPALDLALTAPSFSDRILGKHDSREAPLSMVWLASGNNMQFKGDTARRIVPIDLDPKMERPEERTGFQHNPLTPWVEQERPRLTIATLTILRAYFEAGCPAQGVTPLGSFEPWSDLVRQALIWAGEADPCEGRKDIEAESDPQYERLAVLLDAWAQCYPNNDAWTLAQVWADIQTRAALLPQPPNQWHALPAALGAFDPKYDGKSLNTRVLGDAFRTFQGRTLAGRRFVKAGLSHHAQRWAIEQV